MLASYVHDMGGGLVMIGGPDTSAPAAGSETKLAEVLPVNMEIPAQRQIPKGALVLIMHSCEMPQGNYWGEQCALAALKTLAPKDEIGVISYGWSGNDGNGRRRRRGAVGFPAAGKGRRVQGHRRHQEHAARRHAQLRRRGHARRQRRRPRPAVPAQLQRQAAAHHHHLRRRPAACNQDLLDLCKKEKISISTVTVFPHNPGTPLAADDGDGREDQGPARTARSRTTPTSSRRSSSRKRRSCSGRSSTSRASRSRSQIAGHRQRSDQRHRRGSRRCTAWC